MAVSLVVEDGTGVTTANSYLTATEADEILCVNPVAYAVWTALDSTQRDAYLVWASDYIDCYVHWYGKKTFPSSGLRWPRTGVCTIDSIEIPANVIPQKLKNAVANLAIFLTSSAAAQSGGTASVAPPGIKRVKADVVEVEFFSDSEGGGSGTEDGSDLLPVNMRFLVRGLGIIKIGRQRIGKIIR